MDPKQEPVWATTTPHRDAKSYRLGQRRQYGLSPTRSAHALEVSVQGAVMNCDALHVLQPHSKPTHGRQSRSCSSDGF